MARPHFVSLVLVCLLIAGALNQPTYAAEPHRLSHADAAFKREHLGHLTSRRGANHRVWDELIRIAVQHEDREVLDAMLTSRRNHDPGSPLALYRFDMYSVYRAKPEFFINTAARHFHGNIDCAVDLLVPDSQIISYPDVEGIARGNGSHPSPALRAFIRRAREHYARISRGEGSNLKLEACW